MAQRRPPTRPESVTGADLALRSLATFLVETGPLVTSIGQVARRQIEDYKPWLGKTARAEQGLATAALVKRAGRSRRTTAGSDRRGESASCHDRGTRPHMSTD